MNEDSKQPKSGHVHLAFLDGLRGLSALYVVLFHAYEQSGNGRYGGMHKNLPQKLVNSLGWLSFGHLAVVIFIALSGYCLMIPVAAELNLRGGFWNYLMRRARRILPPYFAALIVTGIAIVTIPVLGWEQETYWNQVLPAFSSGSIVSHLFLFHNLTQWSSKINYPLWSVASEWQIYFLFPLLLLPLLRKLGSWLMLAFALCLGISIHYIFHGQFDPAAPQFIGVFALGMIGALINFSPSYAGLKAFPWRAISIVGFCALFLSTCFAPTLLGRPHLSDSLVGLIVVALLITGTELKRDGKSSPTIQLLESPISVGLGKFSYSIYLMHGPVLALVYWLFRGFNFSPMAIFLFLLSVGVAASVAFSYLFHLLFERPFIASKYKAKT